MYKKRLEPSTIPTVFVTHNLQYSVRPYVYTWIIFLIDYWLTLIDIKSIDIDLLSIYSIYLIY